MLSFLLFLTSPVLNGATPVSGDTRYLWTDDYMADPAGHVIDGKLFIYTSHDWDSPGVDSTDGAHYDMKDYYVFTIDGDDSCHRVDNPSVNRGSEWELVSALS